MIPLDSLALVCTIASGCLYIVISLVIHLLVPLLALLKAALIRPLVLVGHPGCWERFFGRRGSCSGSGTSVVHNHAAFCFNLLVVICSSQEPCRQVSLLPLLSRLVQYCASVIVDGGLGVVVKVESGPGGRGF